VRRHDVTRSTTPARQGLLQVSQPLPGGHSFSAVGLGALPQSLSHIHVSTPDQADLIGFFQGLPEDRKRRGIRYPQWFLLLLAILGVYCFAEG